MGRETAPHISNLRGEFMDDNVCVYNSEQRCVESEKIALLEQRVDDLETWKNETKEFHSNFYDWQREQIVMNTRLDERLKGIETSLNKFNSGLMRNRKSLEISLTRLRAMLRGLLLPLYSVISLHKSGCRSNSIKTRLPNRNRLYEL